MPAATTSVISWLTGLGWDATEEQGAPIRPGPYIQAMPDRLVTITTTPGPGYGADAALDVSAFQARVRGPQNDPAGAEQLAYQLDTLILNALFPAILGDGTVLVHVHRLGSPPQLLSPGPDTGDRYELTCTYLCFAGTPGLTT
jgi:hypothetical protein